jgi:hypothetical protein
MWLREQRAAGAAWQKLATGEPPRTRSQAIQQRRFEPSAAAPALQEELVWSAGQWGQGRWGPPRSEALPRHWQALWGRGRWPHFHWGRRRTRAR